MSEGTPESMEEEAHEDQAAMSFLEHLEELRRRLLLIGAAILLGFVVSWAFSGPIFTFLAKPITTLLPPEENRLAYTALTQPFILYLKVALLSGIFLSSPFVLAQIWLFISPGLYRTEKRYLLPLIIFSTLFFFIGGMFGYYVAFPHVVGFFLSVGEEFRQVITVDRYFSMLAKTLLGMGIVFELPVFTFFLSRMGLITPSFLIHQFRYIFLLIFLSAALLSPPDLISQFVFAIPMLGLYALSIGIAWIFGP